MSSRILRLPAVLAAVLLSFLPLAAQAGESSPAPDQEEQETEQSEKPAASLADVLSGSSGVRVATMCTNCNVASVTMYGQSGDRVQIWRDGLPVVGGLAGIYLLSVIPGQAIAHTEIVRGAGTVLSGAEAGAGAVVLETKLPEKEPRIYASADIGGLKWSSQKFDVSGKLGRIGLGFIGTAARSDGSDPNHDGDFELGSFNRTTAHLAGTYDLGPGSRLRVDGLRYRESQRGSKGGYFGPSFPFQPSSFLAEDIDIKRDEISVGWDQQFNDGSLLTARGRYARRDQDTSDNFPGGHRPYMFVDEFSRAAEIRYQRPVWERHFLTVGAAGRYLDVTGFTLKRTVLFPKGQKVVEQVDQAGVFAQIDFSLPRRIDLSVGARFDRFRTDSLLPTESRIDLPQGEQVKKRILPRLRLAWKATRNLALSFTAGDALTVAQPSFQRVCCGATVMPNSTVGPETSRNYLLEADFVPWTWLKLRAGLFRSDFNDMIQKVVWRAFPNFIPTYVQVNYGGARFEGAEFGVDTRFFDRLTVGLQGSRLRAHSDEKEIRFLGSPFMTLPGNRIPYLAEDQAQGFIKWDDPVRGLNLAFQAQYTGSMLVQDLQRPVGAAQFFWETPAFWAYNFNVKSRLAGRLSAFAGVDNITGRVQSRLEDPRVEYNWGLLRGRYMYAGLSYEM